MGRSLSAKSTLAVGFPLLMVALSAHAGTIVFVDADADGANDGSSWENAYTDLQDALANAADSAGEVSEVWVAEGNYSPAPLDGDRTATFQLLSGVALYGGFAGDETEFDQRDWEVNLTILSGDLNGDDGSDFANNAENSYHVVTGSDTDPTAVLDGFTITAGHADGVFPHESGAGLDNLYGSPTVANCRFVANVAQSGGGVYNRDSSPTLTNCAFEGNVGTSVAGGMYNISHSSPVITNCTFVANSGGYHGGGMDSYDNSSPTMIGCTFSENSADVAGGGVHSHFQSNPTLIDCTFRLNSVAAELGSGGALYSDYGETTLINCIFGANSATGPYSAGGAVYSDTGELTMTNCTFSGNTAEYGAAFMNEISLAVLANCTLSGNHAQEVGGGAYNLYGLTIVNNCILWGNTDSGGTTEPAQIYANGSTTVTYTCIQGLDTFAGNGNIGDDPLFIDPDGPDGVPGTQDDDLHLLLGSPCIDAADNDAVPPDAFDLDGDGDKSEPIPLDLDGNQRFVDDPATEDTGNGRAPIVDMGAYEFQVDEEPCEGDANGDGLVDPLDSGFVLARFGCPVGTGDPDCDVADQNGDGLVDPLDVGFVLARFGDCP